MPAINYESPVCRPREARSQFNQRVQPPPIAIPVNHKPAIEKAKGYCSGTYPRPLTAEDYVKQKTEGWLAAVKREVQETIDDAKNIRDLPAKLGFSIAALSLVLITYSHIQVQSNEQQQRAISNHSEVWASNPDQTK